MSDTRRADQREGFSESRVRDSALTGYGALYSGPCTVYILSYDYERGKIYDMSEVKYTIYTSIAPLARLLSMQHVSSGGGRDARPVPIDSVCPLSDHTRTSGGNRGLGNAAG